MWQTKHQILTFERLEPAYVCQFYFLNQVYPTFQPDKNLWDSFERKRDFEAENINQSLPLPP